ncbi:MAG: SDR family oxidoreductase [Fimbriimonadaceae bacterium]|nr:SDR family oxidoreductase [Fimbriimonadaceae bacterium]
MQIDLSGKVAVVSGSSRGIGRACAVELARAGADVVVNYRTHPADAAQAAERIRDLGRRAVVVQADVATREGCEALISAATEQLGRLDIVVVNAVQSVRKPVVELSVDDVAVAWNSILWHAFHLSQLGARVLQAQGQGGRIIYISSVHASFGYPTAMAYNAGKAGMNHMARTLASELARDRILVNTIEPGWINTEGERQFFSDEEIAAKGRTLPLGRLGWPEEIAYMTVFLASEQAAYITGSMLRVDGGYVLPRTVEE